MQSGISASQELVAKFNDLLASDEHFGLLATISSESMKPTSFLTPSSPSSDFASDVSSLLGPVLKPNEALYIILRRYSSSPRFVAVTYVPDAAPVRQKMLFASTRLTLVRELGSEHFRETIFATTAEELTPAGFDRHDAHVAQDAPLTEEERSLGEVKRAEQEAGQGTATRDIRLSGHVSTPIKDDALAALKELGPDSEDGRTLVMLKVNPESEVIELVEDSSSPTSIAELTQTISATEPRYTFYRYTHEYGGYKGSPLLFIYTLPVTPGRMAVKSRMLYPLNKRTVLEIAAREGLNVEKKFEVEDPSEITEEVVLGELHPKVEVRKGFSRPKRPGR